MSLLMLGALSRNLGLSAGMAGENLASVPLEKVGESFKEAIAWLRSEPQDDLTEEELTVLVAAYDLAISRKLEEAITNCGRSIRITRSASAGA